ncbi:hypothetical protein AXF42_Ash002985 [Apostasia shenzhenica]|uniref:Uncharacterized protein n=1 Tax=Apostasia shenzhenica TaxID=1088818 RepID=A0A2I0A7V0_9ASPA|nr:hypothetical protein AXF42_Ash002985 [Apostasia shenzhenica]
MHFMTTGGHVTSGSASPHPEHPRGSTCGIDFTSLHIEQKRYRAEQQTPRLHNERFTLNCQRM